MNQPIKDGEAVIITGTNGEFDGMEGVVSGIHPVGTYKEVKEPIFMVYHAG